jgi:hypothetical protein
MAQMGLPYNSCWNWSKEGTQFSGRAAKWGPVTPHDQTLRCLPEVFPSEVQVLNSAPPCPPAECSGNIGPETCPKCKMEFMSVLNGYALGNIVDTRNPFIRN